MKNIITLLFFLFCSVINVCAQANKTYSIEKMQERIAPQLEVFPQEKIHLHLDRDYYIPGERIWFKAYVVDALTHQSPTYSRYVYVELINSADSLVNRVMIRRDSLGLYHGNIFIGDMVTEGYYTVRAYTRYMENLSEDYFFKKNIRIGSLSAMDTDKKQKNRKRHAKVDYDVSFYPEGGHLLDGDFCRVAFKALNEDGTSESVSGEVVDQSGAYVCDAKTLYAGMGSFSFVPVQGKQYFLKSKNSQGKEKQFKLPAVIRESYALVTSYRGRNHAVSVKKTAGLPKASLYLLIHCGGEVFYFKEWNWKNNLLMFSADILPSGVMQIVLFDREMNPLSERLIFNKNEHHVRLAFSTNKPVYERRDKIVSGLLVTDQEGMPLTGHLSVSVTDDKDITVDSLTTILSTLLLSSELRGSIETPAYYLQDNIQSEAALDLLMMTHGWRRYNIPEVVKGNVEIPEIKFEDAKNRSGKVQSLFLGKPVIGGDVVYFASDGTILQTQTDTLGYFNFGDFDYPDSTHIFIQARNQKGKDRVELVLNEESFPVLKHMPHSTIWNYNGADHPDAETKDDFMKKAEQRAQYDEDIRMIHLKEVEVTAKRIEKKDEARLQYWANSSSDVTIYREQIERRNPLLVTDLLHMIAGVQVAPDGTISIRGQNSIMGRSLPYVLIDGVPIEWPDVMFSIYDSPLESVNIFDVESIDIFKGASAAIFGMRGGGGAISITTRRGTSFDHGEKMSFNHASINPLGYQQPVEFYSPKYDTPEAKNLSNPDYRTTLFWKPDVVLSKEGKASFEFYSSDFQTTYSVVIEGVSTDGKIIRQVGKIVVE